MKKFIILAVSIATLSLASCGAGSTQTKSATTDSTKTATVKVDSTKAACCVVKKDTTKTVVAPKVDSTKKTK